MNLVYDVLKFWTKDLKSLRFSLVLLCYDDIFDAKCPFYDQAQLNLRSLSQTTLYVLLLLTIPLILDLNPKPQAQTLL